MDRYIERLVKTGLTEYEAKTYYALLQKSSLSATEISRLGAVPRTRVYEVLNNLIVKGFCAAKEGKVRRYQAINPKFAFNEFIDNMENDLERKKREIDSVRESLLPLYKADKNSDESIEYAYIVKERNHVNEKVSELGMQTTKEIITFNKSPYAIDMEKPIKRGRVEYIEGLNYKFITEENDLEDEIYFQFMQLWEKAGAEIRVVKEVPVKMVIFDRKTIVISLPDKVSTKPQYTSMIIDHIDLSRFFLQIFDVYYREGKRFEDYVIEKREKKL
ncbi:MAG: helix-turn-helix domain-containing protein [Candidatus Stygibacter australis]|nr:helix-turn-helix domain-containing protein [Candidatus Stygibacter australis]